MLTQPGGLYPPKLHLAATREKDPLGQRVFLHALRPGEKIPGLIKNHLAGGPKAPPDWNKPKKTAPATKKPGDLISGQASFKHGSEQRTYTFVEGHIEKPGGDMFVLSVDFKDKADTSRNFLDSEGRFLRLMLAASKPGKLRKMQIAMLVAKDEQGNSQKKSKSQCELTLTKVGEKEFAGKGSCPSGLIDHEKKQARPVTELEFFVKAF